MPEPQLQPAQIAQLSRAELARLDLTRLRGRALAYLIERQGELHDWRRACLAIAEFSRRRGKAAADEYLQGVIYHATRARQYDVARQLLAQLERPELAPDLELEVVLAERGRDALARLDAAARAALQDDGLLSTVDVAHATLRTIPALGILLARGALLDGNLTDARALLDVIEEARSVVGLPLPDAAQDLFSLLSEMHGQRGETARIAAERAHLLRTTAELRTSLQKATARLAVVEQQLAEQRRELERAQCAGADVRSPGDLAAERQRDALRRRIDELRALIRERNEERAHLRRQLDGAARDGESDAVAALPPPPQRTGADQPVGSAADDELLQALPDQTEARRVLVPRFGPSAAASIGATPRHVAASAVRTAGMLAAGDRAAWERVKQAKDMPLQVLMARVGIHHRLLFRIADGSFDVLDLVARKDLLLALKRLRCGER